MKRLTHTFVGVGAILLVALGLLVARALESVTEERELRHQAVAERIFDEMERELTELVAREEARPFEHYLYYYVSASTGRLERSPLADPPDAPYIVGYFQVEPGGRVSSPHHDARAAARQAASGETDPPARIETARRVAALLEVARVSADRDSREEEELASAGAGRAVTQRPGTTESLSSKDHSLRDAEPDSSYLESLSDLNRGALERQQRVSKLSQVATTNVAEIDPSETTLDPVDVILDSMVGRPAGDGHLLLVRRATANGAAFEQGLVIAVEPLIAWLETTVLAGSELGALTQLTTVSGVAPRSSPDARRYRRRFAEPFAEVVCLLTLAPLPEATGVAYIYWLSLLLALAVAAGLLGLYRMVAVTVSFAERQRNFVSSVTHELKTPLTAIRMYGEMLRDGIVPSEEKKQQYYQVITSESERLTRLVGNVLELSRLERRHRSLRPAPGDVRQVLEKVVEVLGPHARSEGFELRVDVEVEPENGDRATRAIFDADALVQVVFNLVDNALKYAKRPAASFVDLRARRRGDEVVVTVSDRGPGVSQEHLAHVFEPFYRGEREMTRSSKGTGIGLALVRGLVEEMGGRVEGVNLDGGGFEVSLFLRAA